LAPKDVEDTARGVLAFDGGPLFSVHAAWASHATRDVTRLVLEGADARAELTCTFGMSPNRVASTLVVHREGQVSQVELPQDEVGAEYRRQLDLLPALLADPEQRGVATAEVSKTIDVIERLYRSAGAPRLSGSATSPARQCAVSR
jgi:oxidoreductase